MVKKTTPEPDFETRMQRLQDIVQELERADLPLEKNVALYKEGRALSRACKEMLDKARHEISLCDEQGGESPFVLDADGEGPHD
ncbi:MAG: exodeoxyribonuclease VII small subunit [Desulfovibrio sp.]|jgi:exodeoxyribonuclease VII small subunit|nr:exodeoxyribonuclease VII small subunit [Desulfovibrio sp.]